MPQFRAIFAIWFLVSVLSGLLGCWKLAGTAKVGERMGKTYFCMAEVYCDGMRRLWVY